MKALGSEYKRILWSFAEKVQVEISELTGDSLVKIIPIKVSRSHTFGWWTPMVKLKTIPGQLELWLDLCPNIGRPILSVCYYSSDIKRVTKVVEAFTNHQIKKFVIGSENIKEWPTGPVTHSKPLPMNYFGKPLIEIFGSYKFLTIYFSEKLNSKKLLLNAAISVSRKLVRTVSSALETSPAKERDYSAIENRKKVTQHLIRERSQKLARIAKIRDSFTCQICDFNFAEKYGDIGRGFAEAHHRIPLSKLKKGVKTEVKDLITVCPNCHRMLHRMESHKGDVALLRNRIRAKRETKK